MMSAWTTHLDPALLLEFTRIGFSAGNAEVMVHVIEDVLREDSPAGDALRERLGLRFVYRQHPDGTEEPFLVSSLRALPALTKAQAEAERPQP